MRTLCEAGRGNLNYVEVPWMLKVSVLWDLCPAGLQAGSGISPRVEAFAVIKTEITEPCKTFDIRHKSTEFGVCPDKFLLLCLVLFHCAPLSPFWNGNTYFVPCMLEECNLFFNNTRD